MNLRNLSGTVVDLVWERDYFVSGDLYHFIKA
jgi:hypothetical protein